MWGFGEVREVTGLQVVFPYVRQVFCKSIKNIDRNYEYLFAIKPTRL